QSKLHHYIFDSAKEWLDDALTAREEVRVFLEGGTLRPIEVLRKEAEERLEKTVAARGAMLAMGEQDKFKLLSEALASSCGPPHTQLGAFRFRQSVQQAHGPESATPRPQVSLRTLSKEAF